MHTSCAINGGDTEMFFLKAFLPDIGECFWRIIVRSRLQVYAQDTGFLLMWWWWCSYRAETLGDREGVIWRKGHQLHVYGTTISLPGCLREHLIRLGDSVFTLLTNLRSPYTLLINAPLIFVRVHFQIDGLCYFPCSYCSGTSGNELNILKTCRQSTVNT